MRERSRLCLSICFCPRLWSVKILGIREPRVMRSLKSSWDGLSCAAGFGPLRRSRAGPPGRVSFFSWGRFSPRLSSAYSLWFSWGLSSSSLPSRAWHESAFEKEFSVSDIVIPVLLSLILGPGIGQLYNKEYKKGAYLVGLSLLVLVGAIAWFLKAM